MLVEAEPLPELLLALIDADWLADTDALVDWLADTDAEAD